jgi:hypothetical protein
VALNRPFELVIGLANVMNVDSMTDDVTAVDSAGNDELTKILLALLTGAWPQPTVVP